MITKGRIKAQGAKLMKAINVEDLPEPVARALEVVVDTLRKELRPKGDERRRVELPLHPGKIIGVLTRDEIYADVG